MGEIYANGQELCEIMWGNAFVYQPDEDMGYTMWWSYGENPNPQVSHNIFTDHEPPEVCHLDYYHTDEPGPEPAGASECHPWADHACCTGETVETAEKLKLGYGAEYHWDRCGPLSPACERYFVEEACFYECEPAAGLFRRYPDGLLHDRDGHEAYDAKCDMYSETYDESYAETNCDMGFHGHNSWEIYKMPIKASYCDAWYLACRNDMFCGDGDYFSCAASYEQLDAIELQRQLDEEKRLREDAEAKLAVLEEGSAFGVVIAAYFLAA
jgi:folate receptor